MYEELRTKDTRLHKALCTLLKEMLRGDPTTGTGKPEPLRHNLSGFWSRRLSQKDRVITNSMMITYIFSQLAVTTIKFESR
ncbi:type II toxin-antitoxin system YoeB family toxin [Desulfonatronum parangueonense]